MNGRRRKSHRTGTHRIGGQTDTTLDYLGSQHQPCNHNTRGHESHRGRRGSRDSSKVHHYGQLRDSMILIPQGRSRCRKRNQAADPLAVAPDGSFSTSPRCLIVDSASHLQRNMGNGCCISASWLSAIAHVWLQNGHSINAAAAKTVWRLSFGLHSGDPRYTIEIAIVAVDLVYATGLHVCGIIGVRKTDAAVAEEIKDP